MMNIPQPNIEFVSKERYEALQKMDEYEADLHDRLVIAGYWPWWRRLLHPYKPITVDQYATIIPPRQNMETKQMEKEFENGKGDDTPENVKMLIKVPWNMSVNDVRDMVFTNCHPDIEVLARSVIRGDYGNGEERKNKLGVYYYAVQARVNEIMDQENITTWDSVKSADPVTQIR
jgi:hypothetical protein